MIATLLVALLAVVNVPNPSVSYVCDGVTAVYPVNFPYLASGDLAVTSTTVAGVGTTLAQTTDWSVNLASTSSTATLTLNSPGTKCPSGNVLKIARSLLITQPYSFKAQTTYNQSLHETAYDREVMLIQQTDAKVSSTDVKAYVDAAIAATLTGGTVIQPITWNITGDGVANVFAISNALVNSPDLYIVTIDGVFQKPTADYTVSTSPAQITFTSVPAYNAVISVRSFGYARALSVGDNTSVLATGSTVPLFLKDWMSRPINALAFGAKADLTTDNAAAFVAAANYCGANTPCTVYIPGAPLPYRSSGIKLTAANKQVTFAGDGAFATRIQFISANVDGYALSFAANDNSWGGLRTLAVETAAAVTAVVYILNPNNLFSLDRVMINGGTQINSTPNATHGIYVDDTGLGGSFLSMYGIYATSVSGFNYYFNGQTTQASFTDIGGNHDVGPSGLINVASAGSGPNITLIGLRAENSTGKDLIQYATTTQGRITIQGCYFSNGVANSIIRTKSGTAPWWSLEARYQNNPTNIYLDDVSAGLNWPFVSGDNANVIHAPVTPSYLYSGHNRIWANNTDGLLRTKNGGAPASLTDGMVMGGGFSTITYGTTIFPDATKGTMQEVVPTDGVAFLLGNPVNAASVLSGMRICVRVKNTFGALGAMTFGTSYRTTAAWVQPANTNSRTICFNNNASNVWTEESRQTIDVPN